MSSGEGSSARCSLPSVDVDITLDGASVEETVGSSSSVLSDDLEDWDSRDAGTPHEFDSAGSGQMECEREGEADDGKRKLCACAYR